MQLVPYKPEGFELLMKGAMAFSKMQQAGIRLDMLHLKSSYKRLGKEIKEQQALLDQCKEVQLWKKKYGEKFKLDSDEQLADILFDEMGHEPTSFTDSGKASVNADVLKSLNIPVGNILLKYRKYFKLRNTFLNGIITEAYGGYLHPFLNLHTARTFRSCVAKGTKILMPAYFKRYPNGVPIERVKSGDYVYCFDDNLKPAIRKVLWAGKTGHREVIRVHWKSKSRTGYIDVTPEHLIRKTNGEYEEAQNLLKQDLRSPGESKHAPKHRVLAARRAEDELWFTGNVRKGNRGILEHRLIYEYFTGTVLVDDDVIHHINGKHLDHRISNLEKHTLQTHSRLHCTDTIHTEASKKKNREVVSALWKAGKMDHIVKRGRDNCKYIHLTKLQLLKILAKAAGRPSKTMYDFGTIKRFVELYNIDLSAYRLRYNDDGKFISRGYFRSVAHLGNFKLQKLLKKGHGAVIQLSKLYNISIDVYWGNQTGVFKKNNHVITKIEWLNKTVDVYDLEVEECHNFIANEICVHNSGNMPNVQNMPIRDPEAGEIIRKAFIAREGHHLVCADYGGIEVKMAAVMHQDPTMLGYLNDPLHADMHADFACLLFKLDHLDSTVPGEKTLRKGTKNGFTFPQFYGDYYGNNAPSLWKWAGLEGEKIRPKDGVKIKGDITIGRNLINHGIKTFEQFKNHIKEIEHTMWHKRFPVYTQWKEKQLQSYTKKGFVEILTGFICQGLMDKNAVINYPIQGLAFHCLLWSCVELLKEMKKRKMKSRIVFQVHDDMVADVATEEREEYISLLKEVMVRRLREHWTFINIPLELEVESSELNGNWYDKKPVTHYIA